MDLVTIITPIYNGEKYLKRYFAQINAIGYKDLQILVVNDGSKDKTSEIVQKYAEEDSRIEFIDKKVNEGVSSARNDALKRAKGVFCFFFDCDDTFDAQIIEKCVAKVKSDTDTVCYNYASVRKNGSIAEHEFSYLKRQYNKKEILKQVLPNSFGTSIADLKEYLSGKRGMRQGKELNGPWRMMYSLKIIREKNIYFRKDLRVGEDTIFTNKYLAVANVIYTIDEPLYYLHGSPVSASLAAAIMNAKYVNAVPLYRLEQEFKRYGLAITRQNMANWMIRLGEEYIAVMWDYLHELLYDYHVIQADETPCLVNRDGRPAGSKSYMWVYRNGYMYSDRQIVLYEYQRTRNASHPREFLKDYSGICVTDGYQVYHTLEKEKEDLTIAGCWVHCRRRFEEAQEVIPKDARKGTTSYLIMKQIQAIYREEKKLKSLTSEERLAQRQAIIKPLVEALFVYLKQNDCQVPKTGKLREAFTYALNQEKYLITCIRKIIR